MSSWLAYTEDGGQNVDVVPLLDAVVHTDDDCLCGPTAEPVQRDDGSFGYVHTHHSLDGREQREQATT